MSLSLRLLNKLKENELRQTAIEEFRDKLKNLKNTLNEIKKLELLREQVINEIKNEPERELSMLNDEMKFNNFRTLDVDFVKNDFKIERELRLPAKEKINKIKGLKKEVENNKDELLDRLLDDESFLNH